MLARMVRFLYKILLRLIQTNMIIFYPTPNNSIKTSWNRAVKNRIIDNVVLFKPTEGLARIPGTIGIWGIITFNDRCYRLDVNENAPPSQAIRGQRIFNSIPRNPILTEIPSIAGGQMP